jgi:uncharacterized membrane protein YkvA (DUF1232 family)
VPSLARARTLLLEVPWTAKLTYCLMRDGRVPLAPKLAVGAALGLIVSPVDVPAWIPVVGDLDALALGLLAAKVFVDACPEEVVEEHRTSVQEGESIFDQDLRGATALARQGVGRLAARWRARGALRQSLEMEDEPA